MLDIPRCLGHERILCLAKLLHRQVAVAKNVHSPRTSQQHQICNVEQSFDRETRPRPRGAGHYLYYTNYFIAWWEPCCPS